MMPCRCNETSRWTSSKPPTPSTRQITKFEALLEDEDVLEPVKAEVTRELEEIYTFQKKNLFRSPTSPKSRSEPCVRPSSIFASILPHPPLGVTWTA